MESVTGFRTVKNKIDIIKNNLTKQDFRTKNVLKNISLSFFIKSGNIIISLLFVPVLIDYLNSVKYGIWLTLTSIVQWFLYFDLGLGNGLRNKLAEAFSIKDSDKIKTYISSSYFIILILSLVVIILFLPLYFITNWVKFFNAPEYLNKELSLVVLITFIFFMIRFIFQLIGTILLADQKSSLNDLILFIINLISFLVILLVKQFIQDSFILATTILSIIPVLTYLTFNFYFFNTSYKEFTPNIKFIDIKKGKELISLGLKFLLIQLSGIILYSSANVLITHLLGPSKVTNYNILYKYFSVNLMIYGIIITPFWSAFTDAYVKRDINWIESMIKKLNKVSLFFTMIILIMIILSEKIFNIWIGNRVNITMIESITIAIFFIITIINMPYCYFLNGIGKVKEQVVMSVIASIAFIPFSIIMVKYFNESLEGVLISLLFVSLPGLFLWPYIYKKELKRLSLIR